MFYREAWCSYWNLARPPTKLFCCPNSPTAPSPWSRLSPQTPERVASARRKKELTFSVVTNAWKTRM